MRTDLQDPGPGSTPNSIFEQLLSGRFDTVIVGFCDLNGGWRGKMLPAERYCLAPTAPVQFSDYVFALDVAQQIIEPADDLPWWPLGAGGFRDILLWPDPATLRAVPWRTRTALVLGNLRYRDGAPFPASPRDLLANVAVRASHLGLRPVVAAELEFVVFQETEAELRTHAFTSPRRLNEQAFAYNVDPFETDETLLGPIIRDLRSMDVGIDCWSVEGGASQYELNWGHGELVEAADRAFLFKSAIRLLARRHSLTVSFMAKPHADDLGSSMHVHQSLWSDADTNLFHDPTSVIGLSQQANAFLAGQLDTMRELACLFAPNVNSYKRYVPGNSAGMNATWGIENPMAGVRAIIDGHEGTRLEFRAPGSDANPYLALAAALIGGLSGLERGLEPPAWSDGDASRNTTVDQLPGDLREAARLLAKSDVARNAFGDQFVDFYVTTRLWESERFGRAVTDWERQRYLLNT